MEKDPLNVGVGEAVSSLRLNCYDVYVVGVSGKTSIVVSLLTGVDISSSWRPL